MTLDLALSLVALGLYLVSAGEIRAAVRLLRHAYRPVRRSAD